MDMADSKSFLDPISDDARCGPDLDAAGDPAYVKLGIAAEWKEAKYVGETQVSPASAPNWPQVKESAAALLAISKDLRIAKHYVAAMAYTEGLSGIASGVRLVPSYSNAIGIRCILRSRGHKTTGARTLSWSSMASAVHSVRCVPRPLLNRAR